MGKRTATVREHYLRLLCCAAFLVSATSTVASDMAPLYQSVGDWDVRVDSSLDNSCFAHAVYEGGTVLRIGFDMTTQSAYALVGNQNWQSIEYGKKYEMEVQFGSKQRWVGEAVGYSFDPPKDAPFTWLDIGSGAIEEFFTEFMEEHYVSIYYNDIEVDTLRLEGSYQAGLTMIECQKQFNKAKEDPFSSDDTPASVDDPFYH